MQHEFALAERVEGSGGMEALESEPIALFEKVLFASDFSAASQAAFRVALRVCITFDASLSILHVFEYPKAIASEPRGQILELGSIKGNALRALERLREAAEAAGVRCETTITSGIASLTILRTASKHNFDLVVLGTSNPRGFERLVFGSTAEAILREAACPVLTVGPHIALEATPERDRNPVIFATDFQHTTTPAIRYAAAFCKATRSPLHCLHVLPKTLASGSPSHIVPQIMTEALRHVATEHNSTAEPTIYTIAYGNDVAETVSEYARQHKAWLIVLGIQRAPIIASHVPDHLVYRMIAEAPCSILTIAFASKSKSHWAGAAACS